MIHKPIYHPTYRGFTLDLSPKDFVTVTVYITVYTSQIKIEASLLAQVVEISKIMKINDLLLFCEMFINGENSNEPRNKSVSTTELPIHLNQDRIDASLLLSMRGGQTALTGDIVAEERENEDDPTETENDFDFNSEKTPPSFHVNRIGRSAL